MTDVTPSKLSEDSNARRKILLSRLKEILLDEVDEIVVGLFSRENEFQYWQKKPKRTTEGRVQNDCGKYVGTSKLH